MKKLLLIFFFFPMIGSGQDIRRFSSCDIIITQLIVSTVSIVKHKNTPKKKFGFCMITQESSINWNEERLLRWKILNKKNKKLKQ